MSQIGARSGDRYLLGATTFNESFYRLLVLEALILAWSFVYISIKHEHLTPEALGLFRVVVVAGRALYTVVTVLNVYLLRINIRRHFRMNSDYLADFLAALFCTPCAIAQAARELGIRDPCRPYVDDSHDPIVRYTGHPQPGNPQYQNRNLAAPAPRYDPSFTDETGQAIAQHHQSIR